VPGNKDPPLSRFIFDGTEAIEDELVTVLIQPSSVIIRSQPLPINDIYLYLRFEKRVCEARSHHTP